MILLDLMESGNNIHIHEIFTLCRLEGKTMTLLHYYSNLWNNMERDLLLRVNIGII